MTTRKQETVPAQRDHISAEATEPECHCPVLEKKEGVAPTDRGAGRIPDILTRCSLAEALNV